MRVERKVLVGDREVTVRELTLGEIRRWIAEAEQPPEPSQDVMAAMAMLEDPADHQALIGLERMTDYPFAALEALSPSALRDLLAACREVNADFFGMLGRVARTLSTSD